MNRFAKKAGALRLASNPSTLHNTLIPLLLRTVNVNRPMTLKILALDSSTSHTSIGLGTDCWNAQSLEVEEGRAHGRYLVSHVRTLFATAGTRLEEIDAFAFGLGPGSYTGLRVGATAAKTWAYLFGKPLIGIDSLQAVAWNVPAPAPSILVAVDAQRGQVHVREYSRIDETEPPTPVGELELKTWSDLSAARSTGSVVLGPAFDSAAKRPGFEPTPILAESFTDSKQNRPRGEVLIELARRALDAGQLVDPFSVEPLYIRRSAAEDQWDKRAPIPLKRAAP